MKLTLLKTLVTLSTLLPLAASAAAPAPRSPEATATLAEVKKMLGVVPAMVSEQPDANVAPFWEQMKALQLNPQTTLSGKTKELIGLGVSAQIPCKYCIYAHIQFAKLNGANEAELREAVAAAGLARELSALSVGLPEGTPAKADPAVVAEIDKAFGPGHDYFKRYPAASLPSLWKQLKAVTLNSSGPVSVKDKLLISLAVSSQTPSPSCVKDYTAFAKANGASEAEIQEAVAMAGFIRNASTVLNGSMTDEASWKKDVDAIVKHVSKAAPGKKTAEK
jgi:AhpD family alkylhydroperoxidase